jgi:hypothetical protein
LSRSVSALEGFDVAGKVKVLLVAPDFFGYGKEIISALKRGGIEGVWYNDRPATTTLSKALIRISPWLQKDKSERYFDGVIEDAKRLQITDVLVIKGQAMSAEAIGRMRAALPNASFTLYFWDSYRNMPRDSAGKVHLFDRAFTFDPKDALADPRLEYQPLFYLDEFAHLPELEQDIDVFFFGTVHSDRYKVWKGLRKSLPPSLKVKQILYFNSRLVYWARRIADPSFWGSRKSEFVFAPVSKHELQELLARSKVVVDIERPVQSGLTIRTIEAVGARKKVITTNEFAAQTDVFKQSNVLVIDRHAVRVPAPFFASEFADLAPETVHKYSLNGWLGRVLPHVWKTEPDAASATIVDNQTRYS